VGVYRFPAKTDYNQVNRKTGVLSAANRGLKHYKCETTAILAVNRAQTRTFQNNSCCVCGKPANPAFKQWGRPTGSSSKIFKNFFFKVR
jgi:hypothetical protein